MNSSHETILEVDLKKLESNFNYLSSKLKENCKIIAVVKAFGYGHGDIEIAKKLELSVITVQRARQRLIEKGLDFTLERVKREKGPNPKKLDPEQEAKLISLACIEAPEGHARWSLRLLSERMVALDYVDSISHETVRQTLKKKRCKNK